MKATLVGCVLACLVAGSSEASDRILFRRELYHVSDPEIIRAVHEILVLQQKDAAALDEMTRESLKPFWEAYERERLQQPRSPGSSSTAEIRARLAEAGAQFARRHEERDLQQRQIVERVEPYLVVECVLERGTIETVPLEESHLAIGLRVGFSGFEGGMPLLVLRDIYPPPEFGAKDVARPAALDVTTPSGYAGGGPDGAFDQSYDLVTIAPADRRSGCQKIEPGGEAPPVVTPGAPSARRGVIYTAPPPPR